MSERCRDTLLALIIERNDTAVAQRKLYLALTLLARNLTRYAAVYLVCQLVLAGNSLKLQHTGEVFFYIRGER